MADPRQALVEVIVAALKRYSGPSMKEEAEAVLDALTTGEALTAMVERGVYAWRIECGPRDNPADTVAAIILAALCAQPQSPDQPQGDR